MADATFRLRAAGRTAARAGAVTISHALTLRRQRAFERAAQKDDQPRRRARPHQTNAPDLAGERPEAGADLDIEGLEQVRAHGGLVDAIGHADRIERP